MSGESRHDFTATGTSPELAARKCVYGVDMETDTAAGTVRLEINLDGNWVNIEQIADNDKVALFDAGDREHAFRWRCTAYTQGTIRTYLSGN